jgi:hypothetical protein
MLTFVGVGIIHCGCTHSQQLVLLVVQNKCPCSTSAENCCPHSDQHHDEENDCQDEDCCSLVYQHIEVDQLNVTQFHDVQVKFLSLLFSTFLPIEGFISGVNECFSEIKNHSPPGLLKIPLIYAHSQLRL